jgi:hypothetical protein
VALSVHGDNFQIARDDGTVEAPLVCHFRLLRGDPKGSVRAGTIKVLKTKKVVIESRHLTFVKDGDTEAKIALTGWFYLQSQGRIQLKPRQVYVAMYAIESDEVCHAQVYCGDTLTIDQPFTSILRNKASGRMVETHVRPGMNREELIVAIMADHELARVAKGPSKDALWFEVTITEYGTTCPDLK